MEREEKRWEEKQGRTERRAAGDAQARAKVWAMSPVSTGNAGRQTAKMLCKIPQNRNLRGLKVRGRN